jgi:hypothetical protein
MSAGSPAGDGAGERWTPRRRLTVVATIVAIGALIALLVVGLHDHRMTPQVRQRERLLIAATDRGSSAATA